MKTTFLTLLASSIFLTLLSLLFKEVAYCEGSIFVVNFCKGSPGDIAYSFRGWPLGYVWLNKGFIWYNFLADFAFYHVLTYVVYKTLRMFKKMPVKK
jgi:hypothetical protein